MSTLNTGSDKNVQKRGIKMEQLKALCELQGVSGREDSVRNYIIEKIKQNICF